MGVAVLLVLIVFMLVQYMLIVPANTSSIGGSIEAVPTQVSVSE